MNTNTQKGFAPIILILILVAIGAGGYWYWHGQQGSAVVSPSPSAAVSSGPDDEDITWLEFNSKYFNISFKYPQGYEVGDSQNTIAMARGQLESYEIGSNNAFFTLNRYGGEFTKDFVLKNYLGVKSTVVIDGYKFTRIDGEDTQSCEGTGAGKIITIVFDASALHIVQHPNCDKEVDTLSVGEQILATMKFSSNALLPPLPTSFTTDHSNCGIPPACSVQARASCTYQALSSNMKFCALSTQSSAVGVVGYSVTQNGKIVTLNATLTLPDCNTVGDNTSMTWQNQSVNLIVDIRYNERACGLKKSITLNYKFTTEGLASGHYNISTNGFTNPLGKFEVN